jgi:hypothetical protein
MGNQLSGLRSLPQHKWRFRIAIAAATIGIIYGYDLGAIAGALRFITKDFDLSAGSPTRSAASRRGCSSR